MAVKRKNTSSSGSSKKKKTVIKTPTVEPNSYPELLSQHGNISTQFSLKSTKEEKALCCDLGSSFTKMATFAYFFGDDKKIRVTPSPTKFNGSSEQYYTRSVLYYCNNVYSLDKKLFNGQQDVIELQSIKKLLTVKDLETIHVGGKEFSVSTIMYKLIKCILIDACISKGLNLSYFLFTIPTGTSDYAKKVYRNCIKKACGEVFTQSTVNDSNIIILEEYRLLSLCYERNSNTNRILLTDIGNLTVDSACLEKLEDKKFALTHYSAEVAGTELIHQAIEKFNINSFNLMSSLFSSQAQSLEDDCLSSILGDNQIVRKLDNEITKAIRSIMTPIFEVYLERNIEQVILFGAITDQPYFNRKIKECFETANSFYSERDHLKKEFEKKAETSISYEIYECKRTALIQGFQQLFYKAAVGNVGIVHPNHPSNYQEHAAILLSQERKKRNSKSKVASNILDLSEWISIDFNTKKGTDISKSDFEVLVLKFRNTTNLNSISKVTRNNYNKIGLFDIERHSTYEIQFCKEITASSDGFSLKIDLIANKIHIRYFEFDNEMVQSFDFDRNACVERVAVNEIPSILTTNESETLFNWYGNPVRKSLTIGLNSGVSFEEQKL